MTKTKEQWAEELEEAQSLLDQAIDIMKRYSRATDNDHFRRTVVAHIEMAFSPRHSWLGGSGHTLAEEIEQLWRGGEGEGEE